MQKVSEFYWQAEKFRSMAKHEKNLEQKAMLTKMADAWESLAKDREAELLMLQFSKRAGTHRADALASSSSDKP